MIKGLNIKFTYEEKTVKTIEKVLKKLGDNSWDNGIISFFINNSGTNSIGFNKNEYAIGLYASNKTISVKELLSMDKIQKEDIETISIADDNGKVYEFEKPEFNCELKFVDKFSFIYGLVNGFAFTWNSTTGTCNTTDEFECAKYNLTQIKKKWYKDENNFPALIVNVVTNKLFFAICYEDGMLYHYKTIQHSSGHNIKNCRLATKQEHDSLYYEGR